jgi:hypothetical protein
MDEAGRASTMESTRKAEWTRKLEGCFASIRVHSRLGNFSG